MKELDAQLLDAHARHDSDALITLYAEAAHQQSSEDAAAFFLTHAYVYALESGAPRATDLRAQLIGMGREPLDR